MRRGEEWWEEVESGERRWRVVGGGGQWWEEVKSGGRRWRVVGGGE